MYSNVIISTIVTIISGVIGAFIGTYFGAVFSAKRQEKRLQEVRNMALKAIKIFQDYAHNGKTFDETVDQFNNTMSIAEKRAVIVALHKLGIPVQVLSNEPFSILKVTFDHCVIDKDELDAIANQIKLGHCDNLFHIEPEKYFDENIRQKSLRSVAKRWVKEVFVHSTITQDRKTAIYPEDWGNMFSLGEKQAILVFKERVQSEEFYHPNGTINEKKINELLRDIDCGLWDICLYWDYINYRNAVNTSEMAERMIRSSQPVIVHS